MQDQKKLISEITPEDIKEALAADVVRDTHYDLPIIVVAGDEYAVADGEEKANAAAGEAIKDTLWAFKPCFLAAQTNLPEEMFAALANADYDNNETYLNIINATGSIDDFIEEAISADGAGHFLSMYDLRCLTIGNYYLYRQS